MKVSKFSGELVNFDRDKLERSLLNSGADSAAVFQVMHEIEKALYEEIPTKKIYKLAFQLLKTFSNVHAARYNLRKAIQDLGPAGFYFEKFVAKLFEQEGYQTKLNVVLEGRCVSHEIDVVVKSDHRIAMIECKFHGRQDVKTDVKVPMYIRSRFEDLKARRFSLFQEHETIDACWIVTNNRFTEEAIKFGLCSDLKLLSWDFPMGEGLKVKINRHHMYPITCLTTLTKGEKEKLLLQELLTVSDLLQRSNVLSEIGLSATRIKNIHKEANELCNYIETK